ncbi:MAG TPA: hypothetical protein VJR89_19625 [Polyangiales bacterium]|nr:hypothetical protein [Polyangiales bacterium]
MKLLAAISCWTLALCSIAGCESAIVGATCRDGYAVCADGCVDVSVDYRNCGECDNNCGRYVCKEGACTRELRVPDGGVPGGPDAGELSDAGKFDPDPGVPGSCRIGSLLCDGECVDVTRNHDRCGACDKVCGEKQFCAYAACYDNCEGDLQFCAGTCLDLSRESEHCGRCNSPCASGICIAGACDDRLAGQVVLIGHDLSDANNAMRRIAGNAVFLARGAPVRVLVYRGDAAEASVRGVDGAMALYRREIGREWAPIEAIETLVPLQLASADVFLIHAQADASNNTLQKLGRQWANALAQFLARGGVVVLFETASAANDGTYHILEPAKILSARARVEVPSQRELRVKTPGQGVVLRVPAIYRSTTHTVHFTELSSDATVLVADEEGQPVVVQRTIVAE